MSTALSKGGIVMKRRIILLVFTCIFIATAAFAGTIQLPQTGQTLSYDAERNGEDGDIKAGAAWPDPRFLVGIGAEAECVTDNLTGLMWTKNANSPNGTKQWLQAMDYVASLNSGSGLCGYTDWRLPNRKELLSLVDHSTWGPSLPTGHPFTNVKTDDDYWSSTTFASDTDNAWYIYMGSGCAYADCKLSGSYVWPVRGGQADSLVTLTISRSGAGSGKVTAVNIDCGTDCSQSYNPNTSRDITLTATADTDSIFTGWSGECSGTGNQITITVNASKSCTASFAPSTLPITATGAGVSGGTIVENSGSPIINAAWNGTTTSGDNMEIVNYGAGPYIIIATANTGENVTWSGDCNTASGNGTGTATCTLSSGIAVNKNITATFAINNYTVIPLVGSGAGHGSISPDTHKTVSHGSTTTFNVTPDTGYTASVSGTCSGVLVGTTYTTNPVTGNCTVAANFAIKSYTITLTVSSGGTIEPVSRTVNHGSAAAFTVTANSGYAASVSGTCGGSISGVTYTTGVITGNCAETITFIGNGTCGTANGQTLTAVPATNLCVIGAASAVSGSGPWTWSCAGVNGGTTTNCTANIQTYTITPIVSSHGTIEPANRTVNHGSATTFTLTAEPGYTANVSGTCGGSINGLAYTTGAITSNCTETITFSTCGRSNGQTLTATPTTDLCGLGTASAVIGTGPWTWTCSGVNGGAPTDCSANIQTYTITPTVSGGGTIEPANITVKHGTTATFTVTAETGYTASIGGTCGGSLMGPTYTTGAITSNCTETITFIGNGTCGSNNGQTLTAAPAADLCGIGTSSAVSGSGPWTWSCLGVNGGTTADCSANIRTYTITPTVNSGGTIEPASRTVNHGTAASFTVFVDSGYTANIGGTCGGSLIGSTYTTGAISNNCIVTISFIMNGTCGMANGQTLTTAPAGDLCGFGLASAVSGSGPWTWSCAGVNGGATANCSANIQIYTITPKVSSGGTIQPLSRTISHGMATTFTVTPDNGYTADISGSCGGSMNSGIYIINPVTKACSVIANFTPNSYTLSVIKTGTGNGTVTGSGLYSYGSSVNVTATPAAGSAFSEWSGDCSGTEGRITAIIDGAKTCFATFTLNASGTGADKDSPGSHTLTITKAGEGTVISELFGIDCGENCSNIYESGTEVELTSVPADGMILADWSVPGCMNTSNTCTIKMDEDIEVAVIFVLAKSKKYSLKVSVRKGGTITSDDGNIDCEAASKAKTCTAAEKYYGGLVTLSAVPATGHVFTGWTGCTDKTGSICTVLMRKKTVITAKFRALKEYVLKAVARKGGTVTSDDGNIDCNGSIKTATCKAKYLEGTDKSVTLTAASATGYVFAGWSGSGCSGTGTCTVTMGAGKTVTAKFKKQK